MTEKLSPIARALRVASGLEDTKAARRIVMLICESGMKMDSRKTENALNAIDPPTEGQKHYAKREKFIKRMKSSTDRVLNYAKHETLRKIEKHFRDSPIKSEAEGHPFRGNQYTQGATDSDYHESLDRHLSQYGWKLKFGGSPGHNLIVDAKGNELATVFLKVDNGKLFLGNIEALADKTGQRLTGLGLVDKIFNHASQFSKQHGLRISTSAQTSPITRAKFEKYFPVTSSDVIGNMPGAGEQIRGGGTPEQEKHFRENPSISAESGDEPSIPGQPSSLAVRLTFDKELLSAELLAALREDQESALGTAGQQLFDEIGRDSVWRVPSQDAIQFVQDRANLLANVPDEVHAEIMQSIERGLQAGESRKELMARISAAFDEIGKGRAETIANTETAAAFNYARDKAMREAGVTHKKWLHSQSPLIKEPRPTHLEADGQVQPIDEPFDVGGVQFMRPADDSLGAGPEDIINCHCVAIPTEA